MTAHPIYDPYAIVTRAFFRVVPRILTAADDNHKEKLDMRGRVLDYYLIKNSCCEI